DAQHVGVGEAANAAPELTAGDGCDLVDHKVGRGIETIFRRRVDWQAKQRCFGRIGGRATYRDRIRRIEAIVLDDDHRARLAGIARPAGSGPHFAPAHRSESSEIASMNAWSSAACGLAATAADWRCASAAKSGERVSGTQIWIGRNPCRRSRSRYPLTRSRVDRADIAIVPSS